MKQLCLQHALALLLFLVGPSASSGTIATTSPLDGHWEGVMDREGITMAVRFDFTAAGARTAVRFSSDLWDVMDWPTGDVTSAPPKVHFTLGEGPIASAVFDGELSTDRITGHFAGTEGHGRFWLQRIAPAPAPYTRESVTFHNGGVTLAGTVLTPRTPGPHPAIIFVHGSQGQTRWGTPFFLADRFARRGIVSLVYDKRGSGDSTGDWKTATYDDIANDALAGIHLLQQRADIRTGQVGAYGHSEGGAIVAMMAAQSKDVAFIISADGTTGPSYEQDLFRVHNILESNRFTTDAVAKAMAFYDRWLQVARSGQGREQLELEIPKAQKEPWFDLVAPPPPDHWAWTEYRKRADFDSLLYWAKVKVPVLLVYGELDENVPASKSLEEIDAALHGDSNPDYTEILVPGAQHNLTVHPKATPPYSCPMHPQVLQAGPGTCPILQDGARTAPLLRVVARRARFDRPLHRMGAAASHSRPLARKIRYRSGVPRKARVTLANPRTFV